MYIYIYYFHTWNVHLRQSFSVGPPSSFHHYIYQIYHVYIYIYIYIYIKKKKKKKKKSFSYLKRSSPPKLLCRSIIFFPCFPSKAGLIVMWNSSSSFAFRYAPSEPFQIPVQFLGSSLFIFFHLFRNAWVTTHQASERGLPAADSLRWNNGREVLLLRVYLRLFQLHRSEPVAME